MSPFIIHFLIAISGNWYLEIDDDDIHVMYDQIWRPNISMDYGLRAEFAGCWKSIGCPKGTIPSSLYPAGDHTSSGRCSHRASLIPFGSHWKRPGHHAPSSARISYCLVGIYWDLPKTVLLLTSWISSASLWSRKSEKELIVGHDASNCRWNCDWTKGDYVLLGLVDIVHEIADPPR